MKRNKNKQLDSLTEYEIIQKEWKEWQEIYFWNATQNEEIASA